MTRRHLELALLVALAVVAAWLRLADLRLMEFKADEAETLRLAAIVVRSHVVPTSGLETSLGGHTGPLLHELAALAMLASHDPVVVTALVIALPGALAVVLSCVLLRRHFGCFAAMASAILFAVSPWPVLYARKLWPQALFPLPAVLLLYCVLELRERPVRRMVVWVPILLAILVQLQLSSLILLPIVLGLLWTRLRALHRKALAIGVAAGLLVASPYLVHLLRGHADELQMLSSPRLERTAHHSLIAPVTLTVATTADTSLAYAIGNAPRSVSLSLAESAFTVLAGGGLLLCVRAMIRKGPSALRAAGGWILLYWLACAVAGMAGLRLQPHYFILLYPIPFLLVALALDFLRTRGRAAHIAALLLLASIALADLASLARLRSLLRAEEDGAGDYGVVYATKAQLVAWVVANDLVMRDGAPTEYRVLAELARKLGAPLVRTLPPRDSSLAAGLGVDVYPYVPDPSSLQCTATRRFGPLCACVR